MSGKCEKSLKTAFLKITKFSNISENYPIKSNAVSQNVKTCSNWLKMRPTDHVVVRKVQKVPSRALFQQNKWGIRPTGRVTPPTETNFGVGLGIFGSDCKNRPESPPLGLRPRYARKYEFIKLFQWSHKRFVVSAEVDRNFFPMCLSNF